MDNETLQVTYKQAKEDIEIIMSQVETLGSGDRKGRAAQIVLQSIEVLERRLGNQKIIKMFYIGNKNTQKFLPRMIYDIVQKYGTGEIKEDIARKNLNIALGEYIKVFKDEGIKTGEIGALFLKLSNQSGYTVWDKGKPITTSSEKGARRLEGRIAIIDEVLKEMGYSEGYKKYKEIVNKMPQTDFDKDKYREFLKRVDELAEERGVE